MFFKYIILVTFFLSLIFAFSGCNCDDGNKFPAQVTHPASGAPGSDQNSGNLYLDTAGRGLKQGISKNHSGQ